MVEVSAASTLSPEQGSEAEIEMTTNDQRIGFCGGSASRHDIRSPARTVIAGAVMLILLAVSGCGSTSSGDSSGGQSSSGGSSSASSGGPSGGQSSAAPTSPPATQQQGLIARVPSSMSATCSDVGSDSNTGAADKVQCLPQAGVEVDFYQFTDKSTFESAWQQLTSNPDQPYSAGECTSSSQDGYLTLSGTRIGEYACPASTSNPNNLVWDDWNTLIIATIQAPDFYPHDIHTYWLGIESSIT
jgi:hypothetical protein